jgi:hypothetical protein
VIPSVARRGSTAAEAGPSKSVLRTAGDRGVLERSISLNFEVERATDLRVAYAVGDASLAPGAPAAEQTCNFSSDG